MATTNKDLAQPIVNSTNWDVPLNANTGVIDAALGGNTTKSVTGVGTTPVVLTVAEYQKLILTFTGTLTANVTYHIPSGIGGQWIVRNGTTGSFTLTIGSAGGGASLAVPQGNVRTVYSDGTSIRAADDQTAITGAASTIVSSDLTALRAVLSDNAGKIGVSVTTNLELGYLSGVTSAVQTQLDNRVTSNADDALTGGYTTTAYNDGTFSSGTYTPTPAGGNMKRIINGGAFTLATPSASGDYTLVIQITNNASAGAITLSGFTRTTGNSFTTTNADDFFVYVTKCNGFTLANVVALQ
ncbi:prophage mumc02 [Caudoviricetes sp.]|nr:prophage mumc02 [Caudoviricetes sp.]